MKLDTMPVTLSLERGWDRVRICADVYNLLSIKQAGIRRSRFLSRRLGFPLEEDRIQETESP